MIDVSNNFQAVADEYRALERTGITRRERETSP
jgi:hypothetical protein